MATARESLNSVLVGPDPTERFAVECPADGRVVALRREMGPAEVAIVAADLRAAQPGWEAIGPDARARHMLDWLDWILDNERQILELVQAESGKSAGDTTIETMVAVEVINYYAKNARRFLADRSVRGHNPAALAKSLRVFQRPHPLVGIIFPWNYPLGMPMMDVPPALLTGAAVLSKPSEFTPLAWAECVRGFREEIGAPPVIACVTGAGATGAAVVDVVDMVMFTGSARTGRKIAVRAAERLIPCELELGGKDPMIVLDDANIDRAVNGAIWGGLFNAGQACISVERIYVEAPVYDEFIAKLAERAGALRVGMDEAGSWRNDFGALANDAQMAIVERHVQDAVDKGARILTGGKRQTPGLFYPPTVLADVDHTMLCMREETFGPTLPVMKVADEEEALRLANDSPYGLSSSIWTRDAARAERVGRRIEAGAVNVNNAAANAFQFPLPFGGWKQSGTGSRFGGAAGMLKYCREQAYCSVRLDLDTEIHWYPYSRLKGEGFGRMVRLLGARGWRRRLGMKTSS
ncbi:MAG: aldehyde dehydrogenase family protein [Solirubrobacteraceae bacterium]